MLAFTWLGQLPALAALGPWSTRSLDATNPIPDPAAATSLLVLAALTITAIVGITRRIRALLAVYRSYVGWRPTSPLVVLDDTRPDAFTTPAPAGRIVVTAGLLAALTPAERKVVLAHEHAHLRHRHTWWAQAADLATAFNPLLRPTATTVAYAIERWADEDTARLTGDREQVARTLARVALLKHHTPAAIPAAHALPATGGDVPRRVQALLAPPPSRRPLAVAVLAGLLLAGTLATAGAEHTGEQLFEHAAPMSATHITAVDHHKAKQVPPR
ncbi:MAG: M56 family metallopeptidase [Streptosporangiaceae bacterium]